MSASPAWPVGSTASSWKTILEHPEVVWELDQPSRSPNYHRHQMSSWCPFYYFWRGFPFTSKQLAQRWPSWSDAWPLHEYTGSPLDLSCENLHHSLHMLPTIDGLKTGSLESWHIGREQWVEPDRNPLELRQCFLLSRKIHFRIHKQSIPFVKIEELVGFGEPRMFIYLESLLCISSLEAHHHIRLNRIQFQMFNHFGLWKWSQNIWEIGKPANDGYRISI